MDLSIGVEAASGVTAIVSTGFWLREMFFMPDFFGQS